MPTFRCSAGHEAALVFGDEQVRHRCPTCGVDVYKYRDAVLEGDSPADAPAEAPVAQRRRLALDPKQVRIAIGGLCLLGAAALLLPRSAPPAGAPPSAGPVIPVATIAAAVPAPAKPAQPAAVPATVTITDFSAVATDAGTVKVAFRLVNGAGASNDYPALAVHWHDAPGADHVIGKDSYAHPPLPFTTADVTLELERPQGATGIDVKLAY